MLPTNGRPAQMKKVNLVLFELASVRMRRDHVARFIVNANHGIM
jgi:hypothetical protein